MLRKVKLYGELAKKIGHKEFDVQVNNLSQAVSFLINNFPELEEYMTPRYYQVKIGDYSVDQILGSEHVRASGGEVKVLSFVEDCSTSILVEKIRDL